MSFSGSSLASRISTLSAMPPLTGVLQKLINIHMIFSLSLCAYLLMEVRSDCQSSTDAQTGGKTSRMGKCKTSTIKGWSLLYEQYLELQLGS